MLPSTGRLEKRKMNITNGAVVIVFTWLLFMLSHSWLASEWVKDYLVRLIPSLKFAYRLAYNILSLAFVAALLYFHSRIISPDLIPESQILDIISYVLLILGFWIIYRSLISYNFSEFVGLVPSGDSNQSLVTSGMNKWVRHPLYLGSTLVFLSLFLMFSSLDVLLSLLLSVLYIWIGSRFEEVRLKRVFGSAYQKYQKRTPAFVPRNPISFFKSMFN